MQGAVQLFPVVLDRVQDLHDRPEGEVLDGLRPGARRNLLEQRPGAQGVAARAVLRVLAQEGQRGADESDVSVRSGRRQVERHDAPLMGVVVESANAHQRSVCL
jgi:hypothetical protein